MKRCVCAILCLIMLLAALPEMKAQALTVTKVMQVYKCNEYVSLRKLPDKKSDRLKKVHLGELVTECQDAGDGFIRCKWDGTYGYILAEYLKPRADIAYGGDVLKNQMVYNCDEYVSLRKDPDTKSERLAKVPKGAIVTGCIYWSDSFTKCEYKGKTGYILSKYLKTADYTVKVTPTPTTKPTTTPKPSATPNTVYPALPFAMTVINCNEFVSLRAKPTSNSNQLKRVPLGSVVYECQQVNDSYVYCRFDGTYGYVNIGYLGAYQEPSITVEPTQTSPLLEMDWPSYTSLTAVGDSVLEYSFDGYTVVARRDTAGGYEYFKLVCYDPNRKPIWQMGGEVEAAELPAYDAFIAGSADRPLVVVFESGFGFESYEVGPWSDLIWELKSDAATEVSGGISTALLKDGTTFVVGYYDPAPICISKEGELLWAAENTDTNVYWPCAILANEIYTQVL